MKEGYKKTELGWIPEEWKVARLSEISSLIDGDRSSKYPSPSEIVEKGILFLSTSNIKNNKLVLDDCKYITKEKFDSLNKGKLKNNDLIITLRGTIGSVAKFNTSLKHETGFINAQMLIIRVLEDSISTDYLWSFLSSDKCQNNIDVISSGSAQPQLTKKDLLCLKVAIPPLKEQQKIAEILSTIDSQIDDTDKLIEKTKELKKGLMQRLLTKGIGHSEFKKSEVGEIPVEWEVKKFNEIISKLTDYHSNGSYKSLKENVELLDERDYAVMVRITNLSNGKKDDFKYITKQAYEFLDKSKLMKDDIVMSKISDAGSVYLVPDFNMPMSLAMNLFLIRTTEENKFYYYYLKYKEEYVKSFSSGTATTTITKDDVKNILVPVMDKREQKKIAEILFDIDNQIDEYRNKKTKLEELKKGLMQQLLTGKIRVV